MAAAKRGGGGGGVMTGPRGGRYIVHNGNKHYLRAGESPSQAAVRVGAGVAPSAKGRVLAQKARGKFNAGQERQMKKVEASYAKDVARNAAKKAGGGKVVNVGSGSAAAQAAAKAAAAEVKAEKKAKNAKKEPVHFPSDGSIPKVSTGAKAADAKSAAAFKGTWDHHASNPGGGGATLQEGAKLHAAAAAAHAAAGNHEVAAVHARIAARQKELAAPPAKKERPKFDAMADAEAHIAKLKAESAARNAAKAPAAVGGYGGPPPSGEQTNKAKGGLPPAFQKVHDAEYAAARAAQQGAKPPAPVRPKNPAHSWAEVHHALRGKDAKGPPAGQAREFGPSHQAPAHHIAAVREMAKEGVPRAVEWVKKESAARNAKKKSK